MLFKSLLVLLAVLGICLLGSGLTGMVIGETCCYGHECEPENRCDVLQDNNNVKQSASFILGGLLVVICSMAFYVVHKRPHH